MHNPRPALARISEADPEVPAKHCPELLCLDRHFCVGIPDTLCNTPMSEPDLEYDEHQEEADPGSKNRAWVVVINNYTPDDIAGVEILAAAARYAIAGKEIGKKKGTPHLQCYFYFDNARAFKTMKKALPRSKLLNAKGNAKQNKKYCSKDGDLLLEKGELPAQGSRTDLEVTYDHVEGGGNMKDLLEKRVSFQCLRVAEIYMKYKEEPKRQKPHVTWVFGESGSGKSTYGESILDVDGPKCWSSNADEGGWIDRYDGHEEAFLDDIGTDWFPWKVLLRMLGKQQCNMRVKGGFRQFKPRKIVITSIFHPEEFAMMMKSRPANEPIYQLLRRIDEIKEVRAPVDEEPFPEMPSVEIIQR